MSRNILVEEAAEPETKPQTVEEEQAAQAAAEAPEETAGSPEAAEESHEPEIELPEKLKGKSFEEVVQMYTNLESEYGRQANEVGTYRDLVQTLSAAKRAQDLAEATETDSQPEVSTDDFFEDPNAAIRKIIENELKPLKQTQERVTHSSELERLRSDFPDMEAIGADPNFIAFVERNPYRVADAQRWIQTQDVDAARRLLTDWQDYSPSAQQTTEAPEQKRPPETSKPPRGNVNQARKDSTESGGNADSTGKALMYQTDVIKLMQTDPDKYESPEFQQELRDAIKEGRFRS